MLSDASSPGVGHGLRRMETADRKARYQGEPGYAAAWKVLCASVCLLSFPLVLSLIYIYIYVECSGVFFFSPFSSFFFYFLPHLLRRDATEFPFFFLALFRFVSLLSELLFLVRLFPFICHLSCIECVCHACRIQNGDMALHCLLCVLHSNIVSPWRSFVNT